MLKWTSGSVTDKTATDPGMDMTKSKNTAHKTTTAAMGHLLQVCTCGWTKMTSFRVLRTQQGKKGCLREQRQGSRIDQYFLWSNQSSQSIEVQWPDKNQSLQTISTPGTEEVTSTEMMVEEPTQRQRLSTVNHDLTIFLEQQVATAERKLEVMGDIIYQYGEQGFGVHERRNNKTTPAPIKSKSEREGNWERRPLIQLEMALHYSMGTSNPGWQPYKEQRSWGNSVRGKNIQEHGCIETPSSSLTTSSQKKKIEHLENIWK